MRSRNIKPGFCSDKALLKCSVQAHLLFSMLWMMADKKGRLHDDPEQIELDSYFRVRGLDCDPILGELDTHGLIVRYESGGHKYIEIINFEKHQNPHKNEADSDIPGPVETLPEQSSNYATNPADSLIPDSLIPDTTTTVVAEDLQKVKAWYSDCFRDFLPSKTVMDSLKALTADYPLLRIHESFVAASSRHKPFTWAVSRLKKIAAKEQEDEEAARKAREEAEAKSRGYDEALRRFLGCDPKEVGL